MQPVLELGLGSHWLAVASYTAMMWLAAAITVGVSLMVAARRGLPAGRAALCLLVMALAAPVGARLLHAAINLGLYRQEPGRLLALDFSGFSIYGGLLLAAPAGLVACRVLRLDMPRLADSSAPALGLGIATMRVGCFLAGCCFGYQTDLPWGVVFPPGSNAHLHQLSQGIDLFSFKVFPVHPTQLYELAACLMGACISAWVLRRRAVDGTAFLSFILWYSAFRWANTYFRVPPATLTIPGWFYPALYGGVILVCLWLLAKWYAPGKHGGYSDPGSRR